MTFKDAQCKLPDDHANVLRTCSTTHRNLLFTRRFSARSTWGLGRSPEATASQPGGDDHEPLVPAAPGWVYLSNRCGPGRAGSTSGVQRISPACRPMVYFSYDSTTFPNHCDCPIEHHPGCCRPTLCRAQLRSCDRGGVQGTSIEIISAPMPYLACSPKPADSRGGAEAD